MPTSPISGAAKGNPCETSAMTAAVPNSAYASSAPETGGLPAAVPGLGTGKSAMASTLASRDPDGRTPEYAAPCRRNQPPRRSARLGPCPSIASPVLVRRTDAVLVFDPHEV